MTMATGEFKWYSTALLILGAVQVALTNTPPRCCVVPGAIPWDAADCGALYVSQGNIFLTNDFPAPETGVLGNCDAALEAAEFIVQVIRCATQPQGTQDLVPTCEELGADAMQLASDAWQTLHAVSGMLCRMRESNDIIDFVVLGTQMMGPEGAVVGVELRVQVALNRG